MMEALLAADLTAFFAPYDREIYRLVESQSFIATRKLVDNSEEQRILEEILEASKPIAPFTNKNGDLHYLLYTPFRYPPLKAGGRFHSRMEQSLFYGSEELQTSMAEIAYSRFLFLLHSEAQFSSMQVPYTHFVTKVKTQKALLLIKQPFAKYKENISHPSSYAFSQPLGAAMRNCGADLFTYSSARRPNGVNVGVFSVEAFAQNHPLDSKEWSVFIGANSVEFQRVNIGNNKKESYVFEKDAFCINGTFPAVF